MDLGLKIQKQIKEGNTWTRKGKQREHKTYHPSNNHARDPDPPFKMKFLLLAGMLTACAASPKDMSGKMFSFPQETNTARVKLIASKQDFSTITVCHRSITDLKRDHILFSMATPANANGFLIFWDDSNKEIEAHIKDRKGEYRGVDYKPNVWHSICTTWDSSTGLVKVFFDGQPLIPKYSAAASNIRGSTVILLGQEQDSHGSGFDIKQSFVGMISDVHMWDYVLSPCEIHNYMDDLNYTPGNVLNWRALDFQITDRVLIENKRLSCP